MNGWIKVSRDAVTDPVIAKNSQYLRIWLYLMSNATHKEIRADFAGNYIKLQPGQLITGVNKIVTDLKEKSITEGVVKGALKYFEKMGEINQQISTKGRLISLLNYDSQILINQPLTDHSPTINQPLTTNKNIDVRNNKEHKCSLGCTPEREPVSRQDIQEIIAEWNTLEYQGIAPIQRISSDSKRYKALKALLRNKDIGKDGVLRAIQRVHDSEWLAGGNNRGWYITFDWFVKKNNFVKVLEGNYDNRERREGFKNSFHNFEERQYDFDKLEKRLLPGN